LLAGCRYSHRVWSLVEEWARPIGLPSSRSELHWWKNHTALPDVPRKGVRSIIIFIIWDVWKERNDRVFNHKEASIPSTVAKIES
jgi:hypothetical protein